MFGVTGFGLTALRTANNGGKRQRYAIGNWDRQSTSPFFSSSSCLLPPLLHNTPDAPPSDPYERARYFIRHDTTQNTKPNKSKNKTG